MRNVYGIFNRMVHEIWVSEGKQPKIKPDLWMEFSKTMDTVKKVVKDELRTDDLRKFYMKV
ncbi:hypothetical protein ACFLQN_03305 [Candidatus Aenigmatarchaeota archaeon]